MNRRLWIAAVACVTFAALIAGVWSESLSKSEGTEVAAGRYHAKGRTQAFYRRVG